VIEGSPKSRISVVVPVYRGAQTLEELVIRTTDVLTPLVSAFEIILVNDGSSDDSWARIEKLASEHVEVRGIDLMRNFGQHNALLAGVRAARYEVVVTLDDDLQQPPEEIPKLLAALTEDVDVVYGSPARNHQTFLRRVASSLMRRTLTRVMGATTARHVSAFRAFRTELRSAFTQFSLPEFSFDVLLTWGTQKFTYVIVEHRPRREGRSNYTSAALVRHALTIVTGFTVGPLRLASMAGFAAVAVGIASFGYVLVNVVVNGTSVPGFAFLAASIALFSGVQLFALGIIGEYLAKMHQRSMEKPSYVVREQVGGADV
jgi:undecaprenyl-phosphate 4-deoxy-4-formamido-L-arabinose transferase